MTSQVGFSNFIDFENNILENQKIFKGEHKLYYNLKMFKQKGYFNILNKISEYVTLVQLLGSIDNVNHDISVSGYWIFDSNYKKALVLNI